MATKKESESVEKGLIVPLLVGTVFVAAIALIGRIQTSKKT